MQAILQAKQEYHDQADGWQRATAKERKSKILKRSNEIAETLVDALKSEALPQAFAAAGLDMQATVPIYKKYKAAHQACRDAALPNAAEEDV